MSSMGTLTSIDRCFAARSRRWARRPPRAPFRRRARAQSSQKPIRDFKKKNGLPSDQLLRTLQGGLDPNKISDLGADFEIIVR